MVAVADQLKLQDRFSEELLLREQITRIVRRNLGPEHEESFKSEMDKARSLLALERRDEAVRVLADVIVEGDDSPGSISAARAEAMIELAALHVGSGRLEAARDLFQKVLLVHALNGADEEAGALTVSSILTGVLVKLGELDQAIGLLRHVLDVRMRTRGADNTETLSTLHALVAVLMRAAQLDQARLLARSLVERLARVFGAEHPDTSDARELLATIESLGDTSPL